MQDPAWDPGPKKKKKGIPGKTREIKIKSRVQLTVISSAHFLVFTIVPWFVHEMITLEGSVSGLFCQNAKADSKIHMEMQRTQH